MRNQQTQVKLQKFVSQKYKNTTVEYLDQKIIDNETLIRNIKNAGR